MVSRRRRRQGIGKIIVSVESRVRKIEKNPSPKRLKANVVTTEKLGFRSVTTKTVAPDAITPNEAAFGTTVVTDTQPTEYLKEGTTWVNPNDGATSVYSATLDDFVVVTDAAAVAIAQGKNSTYVQPSEPTGGSYSEGDLWIDTDDGNKLYAYVGTAWVAKQDASIASALASANGKNTIYRQISQPTGGTYATGDTWFDSDDDNKIYRYNGTTWVAVQLGGNGLANINANSITTGTIDASVITVSNLDAGKITTGTINVGGSIKISTSPSSSGTTARVEINSTGFYAYNGSVATVSITNTGAAVFSGTVNATGGSFTGYVTAGSARFGAGVQTGKNGIYINSANYWYDSGDFQLGSGTSGVAFNSSTGALTIGSTATIAGSAASTIASGASAGSSALQPNGTLTGSVSSSASIAGTTASTVVSNAAEGATALQEGNGVSKNLSDQIVSISTSSGIKIGTAPTATGNTQRVEINSSGFYAYDGSQATVSILSTGSASFTGTITGGLFRTAESGTRIQMSSSATNRIDFWGASAGQGAITVNDYRIFLFAPASTYGAGANIGIYGDEYSVPNGIFMNGGASLGLTFAMSSSTISLNQGTYAIRVSSGGVVVDGAAAETASTLRNVRITTSTPTSGGDSSAYANGSVLLVREV